MTCIVEMTNVKVNRHIKYLGQSVKGHLVRLSYRPDTDTVPGGYNNIIGIYCSLGCDVMLNSVVWSCVADGRR